jgi:hypothetical protein
MENLSKKENLDINKSQLKELYFLLGANKPSELYLNFLKEDQSLMKSGLWDYGNSELLVNKVKSFIEGIEISLLSVEEKKWINSLLWLWHHHAISCAIVRYKDKQKAEEYSEKAMFYQDESHPNQITKLLYLLVRDKLEEAKEWINQIKSGVERDTANFLLKQYQEKGFF